MLVSLIAVCATVSAVSAQQTPAHKPGRAVLVAQLRSDDVQVRSEAFESVRSDPTALRDPEVRVALVDLLDRENHEPPSESGEDEGYAEYTSWLADTVAKIVDWSDPHQVCILANSIDLPDELADHAQVAVPCLLQRYKNSRPRSRGDVVAMLVRVLAKGKGDLDAATVREIQEIILSTLRNPDHDVKGDTIRALGKFGGADMIPALRASADAETSNDAGSQSIRRRTLQAISEIEKRAGGN
jgi:HEAT repeat protein